MIASESILSSFFFFFGVLRFSARPGISLIKRKIKGIENKKSIINDVYKNKYNISLIL